MALLFMDGFDKYGGVNSNSVAVAALLTAGEWTSVSSPGANIALGLSATGYAFNMLTSTNILTKTLPGSYSRLIGGVRFNSNLVGAAGLQFIDAASNQCGICINVAGTFAVRNGAFNTGTILGTSTASVTANTTHYLEWDITFGNSANYQLWLDGVSILSGTGDTTATANNSASGISINGAVNAGATWDDFYLFDASGATNNAVLLTSPRIETTFPTSDSAVQFAVGATILGTSSQRITGNVSPTLNQWRVRPFTPTRNMTLNSISFATNTTNSSINLRPITYSDSAGVPGTLMSAGATVVGVTAGIAPVMPLTTPQSLVAGTQYWLGLMCDLNTVNLFAQLDGTSTDRSGTATFASGAPGTAPANGATSSTVIWGNVTLASPANYYEVAQQPPAGVNSYVFDTTVGHEDLYGFAPLSAPPANIYAVAVKANVAKSDTGAKTLSVRMKSVAADSPGSVASIAPGTSYGWAASNFPVDPNTSAAWTNAALTAATSGIKVES